MDLLAKKFIQKSFRTYRAADAEQARLALREHAIRLILLDLVLPGVDGQTLLAEFKADPKTKDIPVIIISNLGQQESVEKSMKAGAADYIIKANTNPGEIVIRAEEVLRQHVEKA